MSKISKKTGVLVAAAALVATGLILSMVLPKETWQQVNGFFSGFVLPLTLGIVGTIGVNVGIDKFKKPAG